MKPSEHPPAVSVLMPVYNGERFLAAAVASIRQQTWTDFELIIVDDGSTDQTAALLQALAAQDERLVVLRNETNLGLTHSLNRALAAARGRLVARHDADDLSLPDRLARQVDFLAARPEIGVVATAIALIDDEGRVLDERFFDAWQTNDALQRELLRDYCIGHGSVMLRRACLNQVGGYDPAMEPGEDHDLWLRLAEVTELASLPEPLYRYRRHAASVSHLRRSQQSLRVAQGIENALRRRHGPTAASAVLQPAARAYLRAALVAGQAGDTGAMAERLAYAKRLAPRLLEADEPLVELLEDLTGRSAPDQGRALYKRLFDTGLPQTPRLARLHSRLVSRLYMREVFAGASLGDHNRVRGYLWTGLRADPAWLLNKGVLSLTARLLLAGPFGRRS